MATPLKTIEQENIVQHPTSTGDTQTTVKAQADAQVEYTYSQGRNITLGMIQALPKYISDVDRDFGVDLWERMMLDPQVSSTINIKRMAAVASGFQLGIYPDVNEADQAEAQRYVDFCQWNLANLEHSFDGLLYELTSAIYQGNKVAEIIFYIGDADVDGIDGPKLLLKDIKPKPAAAIAFVVDDKNNLLGLIAAKPGQYTPGTLLPTSDKGQVEGLLPRDKFVVFTNNPKDGDPRGTSDLRTVYTEWYMKIQLKPEYLQFLSTQATPSVKVMLPPNAQAYTNSAGVEVDPVAEAQLAGESIRNGGVATIPDGGDMDYLQVESEGEVFINAFDLWDKHIAKGVTGQTLATEEAAHMARAASVTHQDILAMPINRLTGALAACVRNDILRPLLRYNFGEDIARKFTPDVQTAATEQQDLATVATAYASLAGAGLLEPEQYPAVWEALKLPPVDPAILAERRAQKEAVAASIAGGQAGDPKASADADGTDKQNHDAGKGQDPKPNGLPANLDNRNKGGTAS